MTTQCLLPRGAGVQRHGHRKGNSIRMEWLFLITNIPERGHYLGPAGLTVPHLYHVEPDASPSCIQSIIEKDFHIQSVVTCLDGSIRTQLGVCVCSYALCQPSDML